MSLTVISTPFEAGLSSGPLFLVGFLAVLIAAPFVFTTGVLAPTVALKVFLRRRRRGGGIRRPRPPTPLFKLVWALFLTCSIFAPIVYFFVDEFLYWFEMNYPLMAFP